MKTLLLVPILLFAKLMIAAITASGRGSGTALPGYIIGKYFPFAFELLISQIPNVIAVTGTNGKTTTQTMLNAILSQEEGVKILRNGAGANLKQGILSELLKQSSLWGNLPFTHAILEVEEATLPRIALMLRPKIIAVTNLYRDQLDAYGETDMTEELIRQGIAQCPQARVVVNGDDPRTSRLTQALDNPTHYVSLPEEYTRDLPYEGKVRNTSTISHNILRSPSIQINPDLTTSINVEGNINGTFIKNLHIKIASPGFFHVYNALTAITIAKLLNIDNERIETGFNAFNPAFGRGEVLVKKKGNKQVNYQLLLVKNPASFTLSLDLIKAIAPLKLIFAINDNTADSKDVSWLWDSQLERLNDSTINWIICTGIRAKDMRVRLKYALNNPEKVEPISVIENIRHAIDESFECSQHGDTIYVMPTYTAMLEFRKLMGKTLNQV